MDIENVTRALTAAVAFVALFSAHYLGDQWLQTSGQACKKSLEGGGSALVAHWHCAKHVLTYTAGGAALLMAVAAWLGLPLRPGWVIAGLTLNAITHYVADLRAPLRWLAVKIGQRGYIEHVTVQRPAGPADTGPGTALFHLDQAWHFVWLLPAAALIAGP